MAGDLARVCAICVTGILVSPAEVALGICHTCCGMNKYMYAVTMKICALIVAVETAAGCEGVGFKVSSTSWSGR